MIIRVTTWLVDNIYFGAMYFLLRKIVTYKNVLILANNLENCYPDYDLFKENIAIFWHWRIPRGRKKLLKR